MPYNQYTLGQLTTDLQSLIGDTSGVYWTPQEIQFGINEFLREWSGMTGYWRQRVAITPIPLGIANPWIDLSVQFPALRPRTVTVNQIVQEIQYHICEPPSGITGAGMTSQFNIAEINAAVIRARNKWVLDTQLPITLHQNFPVAPPEAGRFYLPDNTLLVHRAYWNTAQHIWTVLQKSDAFSEDSWVPDWTSNPLRRPFCYSQATTRPTEMALYPTTFDSGVMEYLSLDSNQLSPLDATTSLAIPDDFSPAVKYAAMSDLFSLDGETYDPTRVAYCDKRYENFVEASKVQNTVMRGYVNTIPAILGTIASLDSKDTYWRQKTGKPFYTACTAELVVFWPFPITTYGGELDICTAAPIPVLQTDFINLSSSEIDALVGFVQHYLSIKMGGAELTGTFSQFDDMQTAASLRNTLLNADTRQMTALFRQSNLDLAQSPDVVALNA